jgi:assimilatory nitrate reductase catalytic subunit
VSASLASAGILEGARTDTHCPYCALQCGMGLAWNGSALEVVSRDFPTNRGAMCRKGWSAADLLRAPDRLTTPLLRSRKSDSFVPVSWDEAVAFVAGRVAKLQRAHGRDAVGVFGGGGLTNETAYMLGKFARVVLKSRSIDYNGRFCMASAAVANQMAFGIDRGLPFPIEDLPSADVILLAGTNPAETMPPLMQYFDEQRDRGGRLVVIDPRRTKTAEYAGLHLQLAPGTDVALGNGLLHVALRDGLVDLEFIGSRTAGFERVEHSVRSYWPDRVERITGVPASKVVEAAHWLGESKHAFVMTGRGTEQQVQGVNGVLSLINLTLALGKAGRALSGFGCITGQGNGQGGREHGQKSDQLPGYRRLDNLEHRRTIAAAWGVEETELPGPGPSACEMLNDIGSPGGLRALMVMGANLAVSAPDATVVERKLLELDLLVVADLFLSETARLADVVFPVCQWAEYAGTMTNLEGRLLLRNTAVEPPPGVRTDLSILAAIATALGEGDKIAEAPEEAFEELCRASSGGPADYSGMTYARIRSGESLFWPCTSATHPGTPRLFLERFETPDGRARFHAVEHRAPGEEPDQEYPLYLTTGRILSQYQSGTQTRRVASLLQADPDPFVEIHPDLASTLAIAEGDWVNVRTRRGTALFKARLVASMRLDTLFVPFHWSTPGRANALTHASLDPASKIPEFKVAAAALERVPTSQLE